MSDTPRTDSALKETLSSCDFLKSSVHGPLTDLARDLERKLMETEQVLRSLYFETGKLRFSILANQRTASASHFSWWHAHTEVMLDAEALLGLPKPKSDSVLPNAQAQR